MTSNKNVSAKNFFMEKMYHFQVANGSARIARNQIRNEGHGVLANAKTGVN
jgi:hypothetical protein